MQIKQLKKGLVPTLVIFTVLIIPLVLRFLWHQPLLIGEEAYYHQRIADALIHGNFSFDKLSFQGRSVIVTFYEMILALLLWLPVAPGIIVSVISGCGSIFLMYAISREFKLDSNITVSGLCLLSITPAFLSVFYLSTAYSLSFFLAVLMIYFYSKGKYGAGIVAGFSIGLMGLIPAAASCIILFCYIYYSKKKISGSFIPPIGGSILHLWISYPLLSINKFYLAGSMPEHYFSLVGSETGFALFTVLLFIIGFFISWQYKRRLYVLYLTTITLFALTIIAPGSMIFFAVPVCGFTVFSIWRLLDLRWEVPSIRIISVSLIIFGILFSSGVFIARTINQGPTDQTVLALTELKTLEPGVVLSSAQKGFWIQALSKKPTVTDYYYEHANSLNQRLNDSLEIFSSRYLKTTTMLLKKYNISYIYIEPDMKQGQVWKEDNEGLLFLFRDKSFGLIYNSSGYEIWKVNVLQ